MSDTTTERQEQSEEKRRHGPSVNKVILIGRLAAEPEMRYTPSGEPVTRFRVATNSGSERADFHSLVTFGAQATFSGNYLSKGRLVYVEGRLQTRQWQAEDGTTRYATEVVASNVQALGPRPQRENGEREEPEPEAER